LERPATFGNTPGLLVGRSNLPKSALEQWLIARGPAVYVITLYRAPLYPEDSPYLRDAFTSILHSWHWTS
jgi:hypothetical protein